MGSEVTNREGTLGVRDLVREHSEELEEAWDERRSGTHVRNQLLDGGLRPTLHLQSEPRERQADLDENGPRTASEVFESSHQCVSKNKELLW